MLLQKRRKRFLISQTCSNPANNITYIGHGDGKSTLHQYLENYPSRQKLSQSQQNNARAKAKWPVL